MAVIYSIKNKINGKRYVGKTTNLKQRWYQHKCNLKRKCRYKKGINQHLFNAGKKYGVENFEFEILENVENPKEKEMRVRELWWMGFYKTCDRVHGYNLRRDSATKCITAEETKELLRNLNTGAGNGNYGHRWSDDQKERMSKIMIDRHKSGKFYTKDWKKKMSENSTEMWKNETKKQAMALNVKISKQKYFFNQYAKDGTFLKRWDTVEEIINTNPSWKWQNIYSVCNGYKPTYQGFIWKKALKTSGVKDTRNIDGVKPRHSFNQYTKSGVFIKHWESYGDIKSVYGKNAANIYRACNVRNATSLGYIWRKVIEK
jgi:group I intron endonuclease